MNIEHKIVEEQPDPGPKREQEILDQEERDGWVCYDRSYGGTLVMLFCRSGQIEPIPAFEPTDQINSHLRGKDERTTKSSNQEAPL